LVTALDIDAGCEATERPCAHSRTLVT